VRLVKYVAFVVAVVLVYAALFQAIMVYEEGQSHSWITGVYWALVTMSTLGYGDVVFLSDIGRFFTVVVLVSGVLLLLVVLPFTFIRFFYAPWVEAQERHRLPRRLPSDVSGHVIITGNDEVAVELIDRLVTRGTDYCVVEPDPVKADQLLSKGIRVVIGDLDSRETFEGLRVKQARLVLCNREDTTNTNTTLTVREVSKNVPVVGLVEREDSVDILELSGCSQVLPLKVRLAETLANRASSGVGKVDVLGNFMGLQIGEFSARGTGFSGQTVRETGLRRDIGLNIVGIWQRGELVPAFPETPLNADSNLVVVGSESQLDRLSDTIGPREGEEKPVLVIGGGVVGRAAARLLKRKGIPVHLVERERRLEDQLLTIASHVTIGDASDREILRRAGLDDAASVVLTTNNDAVNIYLTVYCRRLNPGLRIATRITRERNLKATRRAGADFSLSHACLGAEAVISIMEGHDLVILGEGIDLIAVPLPQSLENTTLAESGIGSRTGLSIVGIEHEEKFVTNLRGSMRLEAGDRLVMFGKMEQRRIFEELFR